MYDPRALNIYTDGSSRGNPRAGGIGVRFVFPDTIESLQVRDFEFAGYKGGPSGQMEIRAVTEALREVLKFSSLYSIKRIVIHTDSQYVVDGYPAAIYRWPRQKWLKIDGAPVLNAEQWKELVKNAQKVCARLYVTIDITKIKGHSTNEHNNAVDKLATSSTLRPIKIASPSVVVRRRKGSGTTIAGSIKSSGQTLLVYVVSSEYLKVQKQYSLRCEVMSKGSKSKGKIDFIYSTEYLRAGHSYIITLKKKLGACILSKIIKEV